MSWFLVPPLLSPLLIPYYPKPVPDVSQPGAPTRGTGGYCFHTFLFCFNMILYGCHITLYDFHIICITIIIIIITDIIMTIILEVGPHFSNGPFLLTINIFRIMFGLPPIFSNVIFLFDY